MVKRDILFLLIGILIFIICIQFFTEKNLKNEMFQGNLKYENSKIPKIIIQTGYAEKNESNSKKKIIEMNPEFKYEYYNDNECIDFLKNNFPEDVTLAFHKLKPGAFKADLFRYCYLYINGGVYLDLDLLPHKPLKEILVSNADFISCLENRPNRSINGIYQGFMACKKGLDFLKRAIDTIVHYTKINYYPLKQESDIWINILAITGPVLLYNSMNFEKRPPCGYSKLNDVDIFLYSYNQQIFDLNNVEIIKNNIPYVQNNSYEELFKQKKIYNITS